MKNKLLDILWELYALHRSIGSKSSYGFFNAVETLKDIDNTYIKNHAQNLSSEPYKIYRIGPHIQDIINDYLANRYTRLFNDRLKVNELNKLNKRYYDISNGIISERLSINLIKRYLKLLNIKYVSIKFGKGHRHDSNHLKYGVGSITMLMTKTNLNRCKNNLLKTYLVIKTKPKNLILLRNDKTQFIINIKIK